MVSLGTYKVGHFHPLYLSLSTSLSLPCSKILRLLERKRKEEEEEAKEEEAEEVEVEEEVEEEAEEVEVEEQEEEEKSGRPGVLFLSRVLYIVLIFICKVMSKLEYGSKSQ
jgi:hypothetical protein